MRTTLDFEDRLLRRAKRRAVEEGETLTRLIEKALRRYLAPRPGPPRRFRFEPLTRSGRAVAGIDWDDRDSLVERMDGRT